MTEQPQTLVMTDMITTETLVGTFDTLLFLIVLFPLEWQLSRPSVCYGHPKLIVSALSVKVHCVHRLRPSYGLSGIYKTTYAHCLQRLWFGSISEWLLRLMSSLS